MLSELTALTFAIGLVVMISKQKNSAGYFLRGRTYKMKSDVCGFISLLISVVLRRYNKVECYPDRKGQTAVVTGGGRGLGAFVAKGLARCGMHVIVGVRKPENCQDLAKEILDEKHPGTVEFLQLDTSSLKSVREFADRVNQKHKAVHLLVNNAGIIDAPFRMTEDGFESHLATNYLGHFYLTHILMQNLKQAGKTADIFSRIVNVSSCAHSSTNIHYDDINFEKEYHLPVVYSQSKLAQLMFSRYLNRDFVSRQLPVRSYATHPGIVDTEMTLKYKSVPIIGWFMRLMKSPEEGAITVLHVCLSSKLEGSGGQFISDGCEYFSTSFSQDKRQQDKLFDFTKKLLKIDQFGGDAVKA